MNMKNEMPNMTLENIAAACHGTYIGAEDLKGKVICGAVIDSRLVEEDYLFIPIKGERVDGHKFIPQVFEKGACCVLSEVELENPAGPYIRVESSETALKQIAAFYRQSLPIKVVGISGSVGKTSTKEMIASVIAQKYAVHKTAGNFNNEIGLPLTVFGIRKEHEVAILEMGISDFNEMHRLATVANPDVCVITNIGLCHLENLGDRDGVLRAKTEMFDHMKEGGVAILNGDDDKLATKAVVGGRDTVFFGLNSGKASDVSITSTEASEEVVYVESANTGETDAVHVVGANAGKTDAVHVVGANAGKTDAVCVVGANTGETDIVGIANENVDKKDTSYATKSVYATDVVNLGFEGMEAVIHTSDGDFSAHITIPGEHNVYNALAATAVGLELGLTLDEIKAGIEAAKTIAGRTNLIHTKDMSVIDDCYNANPVSMEAALDVLSHAKGRTIAVLGDMGELGENEKALHFGVGKCAAEKQIHTLFCAGTLAAEYKAGVESVENTCKVFYFEDKNDMIQALLAYVQAGDSILIKASHFMDFPKVVEALTK